MSTSASPLNPGQRYDSVQALRFIAAFLVVVLHSTFYAAERLDPSIPLYTAGANGVRLFFVISGFVMIMSSRKLVGAPYGWAEFAVKRCVRIVPVYWLATTFKLAVLLLAPHYVLHAEIDWPYILKSYFFIPDFNVDGQLEPLLGVGWTLNFEMFFYLVFAVALMARLSAMAVCGSVLGSLAVLSLFKTENWPAAGFYANPVVLDFLFGMIGAKLILTGRRLPALLAMAAIIGGLAYLFVPSEWIQGTIFVRRPLLISISAFAVVYGCTSIDGHLAPFIPGWALFLGAASYSIYLVHPLVAPVAPTLLDKIGIHSGLLSAAASITIALAFGTLAYQFIEMPITRVVQRFMPQQGQAGDDGRSRAPASLPIRDESSSLQ